MLLLSFLMFVGVAQANVVAPDTLVKSTSEQIIKKLQAERETFKKKPERVQSLVDEIVLPHFDFARMSSWVLGKYWRTASDSQKEQFTREFRTLLVRTYAKALVDNMDRKIKYAPLKAAGNDKDVTVHTEVPQEGGFPIPIDYSLYLNNDAWKVYDVNIDGVSLVANYRTSFASEVKKSGLDQLIKTLQERNEKPIASTNGNSKKK